MSSRTLTIISYLSVCLPFITGVFIFKKVHEKFHPFFYFILLVTLTDLSGGLMYVFKCRQYHLIGNIEILLEGIIVAWIYKQWGLFNKYQFIYNILILMYVAAWSIDIILCNPMSHFSGQFCILLFFSGLVLSVRMINNLVNGEKESLLTNPMFFVSAGFIVDYSVGIIPGIFITLLEPSARLEQNLVNIADISISLAYLLFSYALILMPRNRSKIKMSQPKVLMKIEKPVLISR